MVKKLRETGYNTGYYKAAISGAEVTKNGLTPGDAVDRINICVDCPIKRK